VKRFIARNVFGITEKNDEIAATEWGTIGAFCKIEKEEALEIYRKAYE